MCKQHHFLILLFVLRIVQILTCVSHAAIATYVILQSFCFNTAFNKMVSVHGQDFNLQLVDTAGQVRFTYSMSSIIVVGLVSYLLGTKHGSYSLFVDKVGRGIMHAIKDCRNVRFSSTRVKIYGDLTGFLMSSRMSIPFSHSLTLWTFMVMSLSTQSPPWKGGWPYNPRVSLWKQMHKALEDTGILAFSS